MKTVAIFNLFSSEKFKYGLVCSESCIGENNLGLAALTKVKVLELRDKFAIVRQLTAEGDLAFSKLVVCAAPED